jgi:SAM-dependent methyltransferase
VIAETGAGLFRSLFCRSLEGDPDRRGDSALRQELLADLPKITERQGEYQPVYGLGSEYESSPRLQNLLFDCTQVTQFFAAVEEKRQIRLLDVGCNIGYTALKLAEVFPNIVGVDLDSVNIDFATRLSAYTGSSARFECLDFLKAYDSGTLDFINVDCILLFNVAHQFVFTRGIEYTKELIRAITEQVDVTFFELAHKHEYASHQ